MHVFEEADVCHTGLSTTASGDVRWSWARRRWAGLLRGKFMLESEIKKKKKTTVFDIYHLSI